MKYQRIETDSLTLCTKTKDGYRPQIERPNLDGYGAPNGEQYIPILPMPTETPEVGMQWARAKPTLDGYGWEAVESTEVVPDVAPVTKLAIKRRLDTLGKWDTFKAMLAQAPALQDEWDIAQDIRADDPMFLANEQAIKSALGVTDEEYAWLLSD